MPVGSAAFSHRLERLVNRWPPFARQLYRLRYGPLGPYVGYGFSIPSWLGQQEALALAAACYTLPCDAVVVEIGSFLGRSAIMLAGARKTRGSGRVHCIDPFDASGDAFSIPAYRAVADADPRPLRARFQANIERAGLTEWVVVHEGTAATVGAAWTEPIDMLFQDGDQSPEGARLAYEAWAPFLKVGGIIALHNSNDRSYAPGHEGIRLLATGVVRPPQYDEISCIETTTFARRVS
jgi:predicted O-methyltransferase YrrM